MLKDMAIELNNLPVYIYASIQSAILFQELYAQPRPERSFLFPDI